MCRDHPPPGRLADPGSPRELPCESAQLAHQLLQELIAKLLWNLVVQDPLPPAEREMNADPSDFESPRSNLVSGAERRHVIKGAHVCPKNMATTT